MRLLLLALVALIVPTTACLEAPPRQDSATAVEPAAPAAPATPAPAAAPAPAKVAAKPVLKEAPRKPAPKVAKWPEGIAWMDYEAGLAEAAKTKKPVFLLIYADWCPKCRSLAPELANPELVELSKSFVMIKQDQETKPAWLGKYKSHGGYVPRIFFLKPDGTVREDVNSGHPRYPYFFAAQQIPKLVDAMKLASK